MATSSQPARPLVMFCGGDEFTIKQRARGLYEKWCAELGGFDHEIIDAAAANSAEALAALARLREALQTLPFFGGAKVIWLRDCNFLGDDRTADSRDVTDTLAEVAKELKEFAWNNVRLLISARKADKRKVFYKTLEKNFFVEVIAGWTAEDRDWAGQAEMWARKELRERGREIGDEALAELVAGVGPNARQLEGELEKLALYVPPGREIESGDVAAICVRNKQARAFALGDALGDRDLPQLLRTLDEELWEMQFDKNRSEIGILYGLISKVRAMILLKEMMREGWIKPDADYNRFKTQLERVPAEKLPGDKRFNPLALNAYVLFKAMPQAKRYSSAELVEAMDWLLRCNQRLISSGLDGALILQQTLVGIVGLPKTAARR